MHDTGKDFELSGSFNGAENTRSAKSVEFDLTAYVDMLSEVDGSYEEKLQILNELAKIAIGFVDMGFEVEFPQENCGKKSEPGGSDSAHESTNIVNSDHTNKGGFTHEC